MLSIGIYNPIISRTMRSAIFTLPTRMSMGLDDGKMALKNNLYNQLFFRACLAAEKRQSTLMRQLQQRMHGFRMARQALEQQNTGWDRPDTRSLLNGTRKKITNPVYRDYETLRGIARAVLKRSIHSSYPYTESGTPFVTGVFLDVSTLWEDYLYRKVICDPSCQTQPKNLEYSGGNAEHQTGLLVGREKVCPRRQVPSGLGRSLEYCFPGGTDKGQKR